MPTKEESECSIMPSNIGFGEPAAVGGQLWKRNRNRLLVAAYLRRKTSHQMNHNFSAEIRDFHVTAVGTTSRRHHGYAPPQIRCHTRELAMAQI